MNLITLRSKLFNYTLIRIIIALIVCLVVLYVSIHCLNLISNKYQALWSIGAIVFAGCMVAVYIVFFTWYDKRKVAEFSTNNLAKNLIAGLCLGASLQLLTILIIYLSEGLTVTEVKSFVCIFPLLAAGLLSAVFEEVIFRGVIFRITEEKLGSYAALIISAFIFGIMHLFNPNCSVVGAITIAIEGGLLLAVAYMYRRNLWFPIALHFAWNFVQGGIFGAHTSGKASVGLLTTKIEGPVLITGGQLGPEGSVQAVLFCSVAAAILFVFCYRRGGVIPPYWVK